MRYDEPRLVWTEREGEGYCVKGGWREGEERVRRSVNPIPNPEPNPTQAPQMSLKEVASIGVRSSGNLCVEYV